jgi:HEXXH motif-containing protein
VLLKAVADESAAEPAQTAYRALVKMYDSAPHEVDYVLRYPAVGVWALRTLRSLRAGEPAQPERMAAVAAAAAVRAGIPYEAHVPVEGGTVTLPTLGRALIDEPDYLIRVSPGWTGLLGLRSGVETGSGRRHDSRDWEGLRVITADDPGGRLELVIDDLDPYRFAPGSPLAPRLNSEEIEYWQTVLQDAWTLLLRHHPVVADEIRTMISVITPLSPSGPGLTSGTSRTAFGCVAVSRPPDGLSLAVTLAHEIQHTKLTSLFDLVDLLSPEPHKRYYAPWRPDPRPLSGLLHGAYAHLGVAAFWRRQRHLENSAAAHAEFARWRDAAADTTDVIKKSGSLTPLGHRFLDRMQATLRTFQAEEVPSVAVEMAREAAERHRRHFAR